MTWLALLRREEPTRFAQMRALVERAQADPVIRPPRRTYEGDPMRHLLLRDARGRLLRLARVPGDGDRRERLAQPA